MNPSFFITHESISERAHQIWEKTGRPDGYATPQWLQAEQELDEENTKALQKEFKMDQAERNENRSSEPSARTG